jgi:membrane-associated phospholipid phosphatase
MIFNLQRLALLPMLISLVPSIAFSQSSTPPAYFIPDPPPAFAGATPTGLVQDKPVGNSSPVIDDYLVNPALPPTSLSTMPKLPWYETDWGVAGIGVLATGGALFLDRGVNQFSNNRLSPGFRKDALHGADVLELAPLAFALATMVQSPVADPELAHASSIAVTSAAAVTAVSFGVKYVVGRNRPGGANSDPFVSHPFDASRSSFSIGAVFPGEGTQTSSFPSGHTCLAFALITPYAELYHQPILYAIPVAVGLGRIAAVDGHWASDVIGGGFIGWLTADLTRRYFPNSDYGLMIFGDGRTEEIGFHGSF